MYDLYLTIVDVINNVQKKRQTQFFSSLLSRMQPEGKQS